MEKYIKQVYEMAPNDFLGALFEWGSDPELIETEEDAERVYKIVSEASQTGIVLPEDSDFDFYVKGLDLDGYRANVIYTFVNGSCGSFCLDEDWVFLKELQYDKTGVFKKDCGLS